MHRDAGKADGDLAAAELVQPQVARGGGGARLAVDLVMIGQRPQLHAIGLGTFGQGFGLQGATT